MLSLGSLSWRATPHSEWSAIRELGFARYLEEATFDNEFIYIGSFSISMPLRQCVSESSIVGIDWPASGRCDAQLPGECGEAWQSLDVGQR